MTAQIKLLQTENAALHAEIADLHAQLEAVGAGGVGMLMATKIEPTVPDQMQDWAGMDGAIAWHLIERHADNWADIGKMMGEWLAANRGAQPAVVGPANNPWRESIENIIKGDNYFRTSEWYELLADLDRLYAVETAANPHQIAEPASQGDAA